MIIFFQQIKHYFFVKLISKSNYEIINSSNYKQCRLQGFSWTPYQPQFSFIFEKLYWVILYLRKKIQLHAWVWKWSSSLIFPLFIFLLTRLKWSKSISGNHLYGTPLYSLPPLFIKFVFSHEIGKSNIKFCFVC